MWPGCCGRWGCATVPKPSWRRTTSGSCVHATATRRRRCCSPGRRPPRAAASGSQPRETMLRAVTEPATILVTRHADAEYETHHWADEGGSLTEQGRAQAGNLGRSLAERDVAHV